ncbi:MAG: DsbC family protein [bacterium]|nr:DsbC family protein [bacterium]MDT8366655.1 DsbC family protein [bacterium]
MKHNPLRSSALIFCTVAFLTLTFPSFIHAFGGGTCGEGECSDCHSIEIPETREILKDLVQEVHAVDFSEVPGLFIVDATGKNGNRGILYLDFSKSYIVAGNFLRIADKSNVSQREITRLRRVDLTTIPLTDSLVIGNPGASRKVILFTDPQCPFCKKLHPELKKVVETDPDVVFFIKLMPLVKIHPEAYKISKAILCEKSLQLLEDSFAGKPVPAPSCESDAVDRTLKLAQDLGIGSTPTLILPDGRLAPGYRPAEDILELLKNK